MWYVREVAIEKAQSFLADRACLYGVVLSDRAAQDAYRNTPLASAYRTAEDGTLPEEVGVWQLRAADLADCGWRIDGGLAFLFVAPQAACVAADGRIEVVGELGKTVLSFT